MAYSYVLPIVRGFDLQSTWTIAPPQVEGGAFLGLLGDIFVILHKELSKRLTLWETIMALEHFFSAFTKTFGFSPVSVEMAGYSPCTTLGDLKIDTKPDGSVFIESADGRTYVRFFKYEETTRMYVQTPARTADVAVRDLKEAFYGLQSIAFFGLNADKVKQAQTDLHGVRTLVLQLSLERKKGCYQPKTQLAA